jgi:acid phosphatase
VARSHRRLGSVAAALVLAVACTHPPTRVPASHEPVPPLYVVQRQVRTYISSGRYEADVAAVAARAEQWLVQRAPQVTKPAIVLDIDETSLSNWPAYQLNGWGPILTGSCDLEKGPCSIRAWQMLGTSKALAPTLALARRATAMGVAVFFISGRPADLKEVTERNLRDQGFEPTGVIVAPAGATFPSAVAFKAPERRKLIEAGYTIVLSLGDQQSDLDGGYAERTFKLPNPVYFLP